MGGGILLLAIMAQYYPLAILIPLHGLIQLGSNSARVFLGFKAIDRRIVLQFGVGAVIGTAVGSRLIFSVPENFYKVILGTFILIVTFFPLPKYKKIFYLKWHLVGGISSFLSLFVGATGPLIAPFYLSEKLSKERLVSTKAACQIFTHFLKVATFFAMGFVLGPYLSIFTGMLGMVFLGNYFGKWILHRLPERWFLVFFQSLIFMLAVRMIVQGVF